MVKRGRTRSEWSISDGTIPIEHWLLEPEPPGNTTSINQSGHCGRTIPIARVVGNRITTFYDRLTMGSSCFVFFPTHPSANFHGGWANGGVGKGRSGRLLVMS